MHHFRVIFCILNVRRDADRAMNRESTRNLLSTALFGGLIIFSNSATLCAIHIIISDLLLLDLILISMITKRDFGLPNLHGDVILRSSDYIYFRTFKLLLSLASPVFADMFGIPQPTSESDVNEMKDGVPVVNVEESSRVLEVLLCFCHPNHLVTLDSLDVLDDVLAGAAKFDMGAALRWAGAKLVQPKFVAKQPLYAFGLACRHDLENEAIILAKSTLRLSDLPHEAELRISYGSRQRLQAYRDKCCEAVQKLTTPLDSDTFDWIELDKDLVWNRCSSRLHCRAAGRIYFKFYDKWWPRQWWIEYLLEAGRQLMQSPSPDTVLRPQLVQWVVTRTQDCECCSSWAARDIQKFNKMFSEEVERVISKVIPIGFFYLSCLLNSTTLRSHSLRGLVKQKSRYLLPCRSIL